MHGRTVIAVIACTRKLLRELKLGPGESTGQSVGIGNWHANLLWIERRKCVLFSNDRTLFTFLVPGMKKPQFENFHEVFRLNLFKSLASENLPQKHIEYIFNEHREILIAKTNSRSVLGSMNELVYQARWLIRDMGGLSNIDQNALNHELNRIPMGAISYSEGIKELQKVLDQINT